MKFKLITRLFFGSFAILPVVITPIALTSCSNTKQLTYVSSVPLSSIPLNETIFIYFNKTSGAQIEVKNVPDTINFQWVNDFQASISSTIDQNVDLEFQASGFKNLKLNLVFSGSNNLNNFNYNITNTNTDGTGFYYVGDSITITFNNLLSEVQYSFESTSTTNQSYVTVAPSSYDNNSMNFLINASQPVDFYLMFYADGYNSITLNFNFIQNPNNSSSNL